MHRDGEIERSSGRVRVEEGEDGGKSEKNDRRGVKRAGRRMGDQRDEVK